MTACICMLYRQMNKKSIILYRYVLVFMFIIPIVDFLLFSINAMADESEYMIKVNTASSCITIYDKDSAGEYTVPVKNMACAVFEWETAEGTDYVIAGKEEWREMPDGTYSHYVSQISENIFICSSPYLSQSNAALDKDKFNVIGESKSNQNIWLNTADAKWIYENCSVGSVVQLYADAENAGPIGKPDSIKIGDSAEYPNWDPTDDSENNPWHNKSARIDGVKDIQTSVGQEINLLEGIKGYDVCENDISKNIVIMGTYDFNKEGEYTITYYLKDATGSQVNHSAKLTVGNKSLVNSAGEIKSNTSYKDNDEFEKSTGDKVEIILGIGVIALFIALIIIRKSNS